MKNWIRIPGFPPPDKQDSVRFHVLKSLSYSARMLLYLFFVALAFVLQVMTMETWPGAAFLICATLLNLVKGFDSRVRFKTLDLDRNWTDVDMDRIREVEALEDRITKWDRNALDITNGLGFTTFVLVLIGLVILVDSLSTSLDEGYKIASIFFMDAVILILPLWFNGMRRVLKQGNLRIRTGIIKEMEAHFQRIKEEREIFKPALMLARDKTGKSVPTNTRFTIGYDAMPEGFYGIQAQINLNLVQGTSYAYFYCVIPAKLGFGLEKFVAALPKRGNAIIEFQKDKEAEVIVIRQHTTKTSGYHTNFVSCRNILEIALISARVILGRPAPLEGKPPSPKKKKK